MSYEKLLKQGRIKPYEAKPREVEQLLQVSVRDLTTADKVLPEDLDWFGGRPGFEAAHAHEVQEGVIEALIVEDWV